MQQPLGNQIRVRMDQDAPVFTEKRGFREAWRQIKRDRFLYALAALPLLYFVIFRYLPMVGLIIAFQDYDPFLGIGAMFSLDNFVGLKHFRNFFDSIFFWNVVRNTVLISFYKLLFGFPLPIILALLINEVRITVFQRTVQTISYLPHFFSMVVAAGIVRAMLTPQGGLLNQAIVAFGGEAQAFLTDPNLFRSILVTMDVWQQAGWNSIIFPGGHGHHQPRNVRSRRHGWRQSLPTYVVRHSSQYLLRHRHHPHLPHRRYAGRRF